MKRRVSNRPKKLRINTGSCRGEAPLPLFDGGVLKRKGQHVGGRENDVADKLAVILRGRSETAVFIDLGDQFLQFSLGKTQDADGRRHFGLVVDDRAAVCARLDAMGVEIFERLNFRDPWGNRVEVAPHDNIQFTKASAVLAAMGAGEIAKTPAATEELRAKGMWREDYAP